MNLEFHWTYHSIRIMMVSQTGSEPEWSN